MATSGRRKVYRRAYKHYGLDHADAVALSDLTACTICDRSLDCTLMSDTGATSALHIDHCHATGPVRGVLCGPRNPARDTVEGRPCACRRFLRGTAVHHHRDEYEQRH